MKVMHILTTNRFSGAENVVCQIINLYKNSEIEMIYCSLDGDIKEILKNKNIPFYPLKKINYKEIKKAIKEYQPDIIHAHDIKASIFASFIKGKTIVSHIHGNSANMKKRSLKSFLYLLASKKFKHIFWVSDSSLNEYYYYRKVKNKSSILRNIVNKEEILEKANEFSTPLFDLVFLGRLTYLKDPERLMQIFKGIVSKRPESSLAIVGDGELKSSIEEFIKKENLSKNITMFGFQNNPYPYLKNSKIMIMTSRFEGTPMCALEAMSLNLPILSTPTDGLVQLIKHNESGFLSDNNEELVNKAIEILENKEILKNMQEKTKKHFLELNNIENYKEELERMYF